MKEANNRSEPLLVAVEGVYLPTKVFEIFNADVEEVALDAARAQWHSEFGHLGVQGAILKARLATKRDMRKAVEDKEPDDALHS